MIGVGGVVVVSGAIGFVGLIVLYLLCSFIDRMLFVLLFFSVLGGVVLLSAVDIVVWLILMVDSELCLGVQTVS